MRCNVRLPTSLVFFLTGPYCGENPGEGHCIWSVDPDIDGQRRVAE